MAENPPYKQVLVMFVTITLSFVQIGQRQVSAATQLGIGS